MTEAEAVSRVRAAKAILAEAVESRATPKMQAQRLQSAGRLVRRREWKDLTVTPHSERSSVRRREWRDLTVTPLPQEIFSRRRGQAEKIRGFVKDSDGWAPGRGTWHL